LVLLEWKVVFFRKQELGHAEHVAFARRFGKLNPGNPWGENLANGYQEIYEVPIKEMDPDAPDSTWHSDLQNVVNPPMASVLRADVVPEYGGDTSFANLVAAYEGMPNVMKALADSLRSVNFRTPPLLGGRRRLTGEPMDQELDPFMAEHPVVRVHPETGERALWIGSGWSQYLVGLSAAQSRRLLDLFFAEAEKPEYTVRFRWEPGSVAFWDNRSTAHLAPSDLRALRGLDRRLYRVTIAGDVPVGPDGRPSRQISGAPLDRTCQ
jgi:taurine dioxygenase